MTHPKIIEAARAMDPDLWATFDRVKENRARPNQSLRGSLDASIRRAEAAARVLMSIEPSEGMLEAGGKCEPFQTPPGTKMTPGIIIASTCYRAMQAELREELDL